MDIHVLHICVYICVYIYICMDAQPSDRADKVSKQGFSAGPSCLGWALLWDLS